MAKEQNRKKFVEGGQTPPLNWNAHCYTSIAAAQIIGEGATKLLSGSFERRRCKRGQSEIPFSSSKQCLSSCIILRISKFPIRLLFFVWNCLADCFFSPFSLMKLAWWSWASGYQTNLSLGFVGELLPDKFGVGKPPIFQERKNSVKIKFLGRIFLEHQGPTCLGISPTIYRARHPETPKSLKKVSREEFGTPRPELPKTSEKGPKSPKNSWFWLHPIFQLLHPYSNFFELIRIRRYSTVTLQ